MYRVFHNSDGILPKSSQHRSSFFYSLSTKNPALPVGLHFTYNHNYNYIPHSGYGKVGTIASSARASKRRI
jgi:hypothetical protein